MPKFMYVIQGSGGVVAVFASKKKFVAFLREHDWRNMPWSAWRCVEGDLLQSLDQILSYKHEDLL